MVTRVLLTLRTVGLLLAGTLGTVAVVPATASLRHPAAGTFGALLLAAAAWLLVLAGAWATALAAALLCELASRGRMPALRWVACPPTLRRTLLGSLGLALVAGASLPATAAPTPPTRDAAVPGLGLPVPARPTGGAATGGDHVVVRPGDTLWELAAQRLPASAGPQRIAALAARLHRANRGVIGSDPDHIEPGQRLRVPAPRSPSSTPHPPPHGKEKP